MKNQISTVTGNILGAIAGGLILYYGSKKFAGVSNKYAVTALVLVGVFIGSKVQAKMKANEGSKKSVATIK